MKAQEALQLAALADQLNAHRQVRIRNLEAVFPDRAVIAVAVVGVMATAFMMPSRFA